MNDKLKRKFDDAFNLIYCWIRFLHCLYAKREREEMEEKNKTKRKSGGTRATVPIRMRAERLWTLFWIHCRTGSLGRFDRKGAKGLYCIQAKAGLHEGEQRERTWGGKRAIEAGSQRELVDASVALKIR